MSEEDTEDARRTRIVRIGILAFVALIMIVCVVIVIVRGPKHPPIKLVPKDGGGALSAPKPPQLPGTPNTRIVGVVVDGAGLPVAGAELWAEPEQGVVDRALAAASGQNRPPASSVPTSAAKADGGVVSASD